MSISEQWFLGKNCSTFNSKPTIKTTTTHCINTRYENVNKNLIIITTTDCYINTQSRQLYDF